MIAVTLTDRREHVWPSLDIVPFTDAETGKRYFVDAADRRVRDVFHRRAREMEERRRQLFTTAGIDHIDIRTDEPYTQTLVRFFREREKRMYR